MWLQEVPNNNSNKLYPPLDTNGPAPAWAQWFEVIADYYL